MGRRLAAIDGLRGLAIVMLVFALVALVYAPQAGTPLSSGDEFTYIRQGELIAERPCYWAAAYLHTPGRVWLPTILSLPVNALLAGRSPAGWRAVNILIHLGNAALVGLVVLAMSRRRLSALLAACLFAAWPAGWQGVTWIAGRVDSLMTTALLLSLWCWVRWRGGWRPGYGLAMLCFAITLLSKEAGIGVAGVLLAYEWLLSPRPVRWRYLLPFGAVLLVVEVLLVLHLGTTSPQVHHTPLSAAATLWRCWAQTWGVVQPWGLLAVAACALVIATAGKRVALWAVCASVSMLVLSACASMAAMRGASWHLYAASVFPCMALGIGVRSRAGLAVAGLLVAVGIAQVHQSVSQTITDRAAWQPVQAATFAKMDTIPITAPGDLHLVAIRITLDRGLCP